MLLVDKIGEKKELFAQYIAKNLSQDNKVVLARFSDLILTAEKGKVEVNIEEKSFSFNLRDFDLVYFRRAGSDFLSLAGTLGVYLDYLGIPFFDTTFKNIGPAGDKLTSLVKLSLADLPILPSYFCWHTKIIERKKTIIEKFGLPLIAKQLSAQRGKGVFLIKKEEDFAELDKNFPDGEFLFQKFTPGQNEYRLLVLKETIGSFEEKIKSPGEFRANLALGAQEKVLDIKSMPGEIREISIKGSQALDIQIAGVDILVDKKNKVWLLEVNRGPGLTYDPQISPELDSLAAFFKKELEKTNGS